MLTVTLVQTTPRLAHPNELERRTDASVMDDGKRRGDEPNKLKMALLLGDEHLLKLIWKDTQQLYKKSIQNSFEICRRDETRQ